MTATKCKPKRKERKSEDTQVKPTIPQSVLREFVGPVHKLFKIDCESVGDEKFRINAWALKDSENSFVKSFVIAKSFYVHYNNKTGVTDETYSHKR